MLDVGCDQLGANPTTNQREKEGTVKEKKKKKRGEKFWGEAKQKREIDIYVRKERGEKVKFRMRKDPQKGGLFLGGQSSGSACRGEKGRVCAGEDKMQRGRLQHLLLEKKRTLRG